MKLPEYPLYTAGNDQTQDHRGFTIVLDPPHPPVETVYRETALPFAGSTYRPAKEDLPERLREMRRLFEYGRVSEEEKAKNFYRQGKFMEDYEDDAPWAGDYVVYYPTYHDLTAVQLRGYFSWRTKLRQGEFHPIAASAAYLYIYELLNGIGAQSSLDALQKLKAFEEGYLDSGIGDAGMRRNLRRWMLEYAVIRDLPAETARQYADPELIADDSSLAILRKPEAFPDEEVFSALCRFGGKKLLQSPVLAAGEEKGRRLFSEVWRTAASAYRYRGKDLFTLCFGEQSTQRWYPLANAIYYWKYRPKDTDYCLDACRAYRCRGGAWQSDSYCKQAFDLDRLRGLLHEADLHLRRYLKTGRPLQGKPQDAWAIPFIETVIQADRRAEAEAAKPEIAIDLSGLDRIREDSLKTRNSLLTEEDLSAMEAVEEPASSAEEIRSEDTLAGVPLDSLQIRILRALLQGSSADGIIKGSHLMPSIIADRINEALFEVIGDIAVQCEEDTLSLVEDYTEELTQILEGASP